MYDYSRERNPKPLMAAFLGDSGVSFYPMFLHGKNLLEVYKNIDACRNEFAGSKLPLVLVNDFKAYLDFIDPNETTIFNAYDYSLNKQPRYGKLEELDAKKICAKALLSIKDVAPEKWMRILARASVVYHFIQKRGVMNGHLRVHPIYLLNTVSGRSKSVGFNVQGTDDSYDIKPVSEERNLMVHIDWVAADMRAAQILSRDEFLAESFKKSDPYAVMAGTNSGLTRDDCKGMMIRALYDMDVDNPALQFYPQLHQWIGTERDKIKSVGFTESALGRRFMLKSGGDELHNMRSVFNAAIQGTVVHAMQCALWKLHEGMPDDIMTEMHDAITLSADRYTLKTAIEAGIETMLHPFSGILDDNPAFPLRVYVGRKWRNWKLLKEVR
jgi:hypothetical protein